MESWCILWLCCQQKRQGLPGQPSERVRCEQPNPSGCRTLRCGITWGFYLLPRVACSSYFPSRPFLFYPLFSHLIFILFYFSISFLIFFFLYFLFSFPFFFSFSIFYFPFILFFLSLLLLFFYFFPHCFLSPFSFPFFPPNFVLKPALSCLLPERLTKGQPLPRQ